MNTSTRQGGYTFSGLLMWLVIAASIVTIGMKLGPAYMEHSTIQSILDSLKEESATVGRQSVGEIRAAIGRRLAVNNVKRFQSANDFEVSRDSASTTVSIEYEVREKLISNLDVVITFTNSVELPLN